MAFSRHALLGAALLLLPIVTGSPVARDGELRLASHAARQLQIRAPGDSEQEPIEAEFDVSGWPLSAEFNCYIMLCVMDGRRVFQRIEDGSERRTHYTRSGAYFTPFRDDQHLSQRNAVRYDDTAVSAEEFPWESMGQGGTGAHLFPTTAAEQEAQGRAISSRFSRSRDVTPIDRGNWFRVSFANFERGGYCEALHSDPPNFDICHQHITLTFGEHPEIYVPDFDQIMDPATHKLHLFGGGSGGSVKREEGSTKVAVPRGYEVPLPRAHGFEKRQAVPPEDLSQYEGSDMCVDLPDLRNTCDEDLLAASE